MTCLYVICAGPRYYLPGNVAPLLWPARPSDAALTVRIADAPLSVESNAQLDFSSGHSNSHASKG